VVLTPRQQTGPVKFASEHGIPADKGKGRLTAKEVRAKAAHYEDNADK
jgi:hypothetical protein